MMLFSRIMGSGQPMIILHGLFGMSDNWQSLGKKLAETYEVHLVDQRNHGQSFHSDDFSYPHMSDDLREYVEEKQLEDIILIGHSMGGKTAMHFATQYPDRIAELIIVDIGPKYYPVHHREIIDGLLALSLDAISSRKQADEQLVQHIPIFSTRQFLLKNLWWKEKEQLAWRFNLPVINSKIETVGEALPAERLYNDPCLFIRGGKSNYIYNEDLPLIRHHFPQAELCTIEQAGHWVHAEAPQAFYECIREFL